MPKQKFPNKDYPAAPKRKPEEIAVEYSRVCMELGELVYRRDVAFPKRIAELTTKAEALNLENAAAVAALSKETKTDG